MKIKISRPNIYLLSLSTLLLIIVLVFSFAVLIPNGKDYREQRAELRKENKELRKYQNFSDETLEFLQKLKADNRHIITAFDTAFNPDRFEKTHQAYFSSLSISKKVRLENEGEFSVYEVNTTSEINSPKTFYDFLDAVNKSDWIIGINFPIHFKRDGELIKSTFTMRVYSTQKEDLNTTK